ncbi:hypothetical protein B0F90DRAFT_1813155 [Multifurca ochricompacta]|uniref:Protein CPL1-like domain-containing protein n=1 Tax=Multifurca ochricompacta TaxID=376703 RepID=A0AAD4MCC3_9AGAM|nr:hypothetical protein B0F90DRAFT_1813155 [Multifurca ochricompacta]
MTLIPRFLAAFSLLASLAPSVLANGANCKPHEFWYHNKSICVPNVAPNDSSSPPAGKSCPSPNSENWYWSNGKIPAACRPLPLRRATPLRLAKMVTRGTGKRVAASLLPPLPAALAHLTTALMMNSGITPKAAAFLTVDRPIPLAPQLVLIVHRSDGTGETFGIVVSLLTLVLLLQNALPAGNGSPSYGHGGHHWKKRNAQKLRVNNLCPNDLTACPIPGFHGLSTDYECIDTKNELQSCGGCSSTGGGQDCTSIRGAWNVGCEAGHCAGAFTRIFLVHDQAASSAMCNMPRFYQILFFVAHAASLTLIVFPWALTSSALAKPVARSSLSQSVTTHHVAERSTRVLKSKNSKVKAAVPPSSLLSNSPNASFHPHARSVHAVTKLSAGAYSRSDDTLDRIGDHITALNSYYSKAYTNSQALKACSSQASASASRQDGVPGRRPLEFERECASELTDFHANSQGFKTRLGQLSAAKGRAFYDPHDVVQVLIKDLIDVHKSALDYIVILVYNVPALGPIFGPIIYDIKCIIDEILDATENLTDAIINACKPLLQELVGEYGEAACKSGVEVIGICI